ncbi:MAG: phosphoribosylglycinamide formyltransferase [Planctomycetota bacterium]|nr:MAG: phosphoribosylglycinamide formyltransferase [Planctomycetota bacterium]
MSPARLVVLASGGGRTLENLADQIAAGRLPARIEQVLVSRPDAGAVERAQRLRLACTVAGPQTHPDRAQRERLWTSLLLQARPDWVVLAGWLQLLPIPPALEGRVINIHPALLPAYGGPGCYGRRVHEMVLRDRPSISGCSVHFAGAEYDRGPLILQEAVPVLPGDDPDTLAARVFAAETRALPEALRLLIQGRVRYQHGAAPWR